MINVSSVVQKISLVLLLSFATTAKPAITKNNAIVGTVAGAVLSGALGYGLFCWAEEIYNNMQPDDQLVQDDVSNNTQLKKDTINYKRLLLISTVVIACGAAGGILTHKILDEFTQEGYLKRALALSKELHGEELMRILSNEKKMKAMGPHRIKNIMQKHLEKQMYKELGKDFTDMQCCEYIKEYFRKTRQVQEYLKEVADPKPFFLSEDRELVLIRTKENIERAIRSCLILRGRPDVGALNGL